MHFSQRHLGCSAEWPSCALVRFFSATMLLLTALLGLPLAKAQDAPSIDERFKDSLIPLVKAEKFEQASALLSKAHSAYERDRKTEAAFRRLSDEFYRADPALEKPLDAWVAKRANDPFAYLARGTYRIKLGWTSRGGGYAKETSASQFRDMAAWFALAKADLDLAIMKMPRLVVAYCYLIEIDMTEGGLKKRSLYAQALKINPDSFILREFLLHSLRPRWGGSYEEMAQVVSDAKPSYARMPDLKALEGWVDADIGELLRRQGREQEAKTYLVRAVSKGDSWMVNYQYGTLLYDMEDNAGAIDQFNKVISARPGHTYGWRDRARAYRVQMRYPEAMADINRALEIEPKDDYLLAVRGLIEMMGGQYVQALKDYEAAAAINPTEPSYQTRIGQLKLEIDRKNKLGNKGP
ncbi:tetratricopeptide repeat protein [Roseateles sp. NT4]|uniref:tetratricopeptide repeat protein n=1 Tax=Roseateles sp. NT4 TaxID=3453715 RepID=UPI003EEE5C4D